MGGDQLVDAVAGHGVERENGDDIREAEGELYMQLIDEVAPFEAARELIVELKRRGHAVVLSSSAKQDEVDRYLDLLDVREVADGWTTSADVEATKPEPDLVRAALDVAETDDAVMVGDTVWDVKAAARAGIETLAVLTGGFSDAELRDAGALDVFDSVLELRSSLDGTPLA
jgi:HAD superfamily hydrolase (TIGR01549 family)